MQELKIGEELMYNFEGYINKVREKSSSSNVAHNKNGCCKKEEEIENSSVAKGRKVEGRAHKR